MTSPRIAALIVAAGVGARSGAATPKQFAMVAGKPVVAHSHAALAGHPRIERVLIAIAPGQEAALEAALGDVPHLAGGATRRLSVLAGLEARAVDAPDLVLIHDAARPFLPHVVIDRLIAALDRHPGAVPALPVADTLARGDGAVGAIVPPAARSIWASSVGASPCQAR